MNKLPEIGLEGIFILASRPPTTIHPVPPLIGEHPHVGPGSTSKSRIYEIGGSAKKGVARRLNTRFVSHSVAGFYDPVPRCGVMFHVEHHPGLAKIFRLC